MRRPPEELQPALFFVERPPEVPTEARDTRFMCCRRCGRMISEAGKQCGWCGRRVRRAQRK